MRSRLGALLKVFVLIVGFITSNSQWTRDRGVHEIRTVLARRLVGPTVSLGFEMATWAPMDRSLTAPVVVEVTVPEDDEGAEAKEFF